MARLERALLRRIFKTLVKGLFVAISATVILPVAMLIPPLAKQVCAVLRNTRAEAEAVLAEANAFVDGQSKNS